MPDIYTQYLIFELCRECNLGAVHSQCPNKRPERYGTLPTDRPLSDDQIISIAKAMYMEHGFRGRVGWHYYNEPLMAAERMWRLMGRMEHEIEGVRFVLWTNGTLLPEDCTEFKRFEEIHVTDYQVPLHPSWNICELARANNNTRVHNWNLDSRLEVYNGTPNAMPCRRMFTEFIIDYWGNTHLCCYDWQGRATVGNVHTDSLSRLIACWHQVRNQISGTTMEDDPPETCLRCRMKNTSIPHFVPEVALESLRFIRERELCRAT